MEVDDEVDGGFASRSELGRDLASSTVLVVGELGILEITASERAIEVLVDEAAALPDRFGVGDQGPHVHARPVSLVVRQLIDDLDPGQFIAVRPADDYDP